MHSRVQTNFRPDPFIYNTEKTHVVEMVGGRAEDIWLGPEGFEWWMEWEVTVQCPFNFAWFPFDTQVKGGFRSTGLVCKRAKIALLNQFDPKL